MCVHCVDRGDRVGGVGDHGFVWQGFGVYGKVQLQSISFVFHFIFNALLKKRVKSMPDLSVFTFLKHLRDRGGGFGGGLCGAHWHIVHGTLPRVVQ